jgi:hypothetical protein
MSRQLQVLPLLLVTRHRVPLNWPPLLLGRLSNPMGPEGCSGSPAHLTIQVDTPRVCNCPNDQRLGGLFVVYAYA